MTHLLAGVSSGDLTLQADQTIEESFGVFVDHTVQVSLCAFKSLVDAVGGVKVPFAWKPGGTINAVAKGTGELGEVKLATR